MMFNEELRGIIRRNLFALMPVMLEDELPGILRSV